MTHHQESLNDRPVDEDDAKAGKVARQLHQTLQAVCGAAINAGATNHVHALLILAQAANGVLAMLARATMPLDEEDDPISSTATLFAALMAYHTAPCETQKGETTAEFSPLIIYNALKDVEKLSGQRPDERLHEAMCRVARECAADPRMIAKIAQARSVLARDGASLN